MRELSKIQECRDFLLRSKNELMENVKQDLNITVDNECSELYCLIETDGNTRKSFGEIVDAVIDRVVIAIEAIRDEEEILP